MVPRSRFPPHGAAGNRPASPIRLATSRTSALLGSFIHAWERRLARRDRSRQAHPFDWGLEYLDLPLAPGAVQGSEEPVSILLDHARRAVLDPQWFYATPGAPPSVEEVDPAGHAGRRYRFPSAVRAPEAETNLAWLSCFQPTRPTGRAMIVLPQWNADRMSHVGLCRALARRGIAAVRLSLPYHDERRPAGEPRGDFAVSANIGRTLLAGRQAVADVRRARAWLAGLGYSRVGVIGSSLGSCIAFLAFARDRDLRVAVLHHVASHFGDVVWRGISTRHVRSELERHVSQAALRRFWAPISPVHFIHPAVGRSRHALLLTCRHDLTFPYDLSIEFHRTFQREALPHRLSILPWGHYTSGIFPFNAITVGRVLRYLDERL